MGCCFSSEPADLVKSPPLQRYPPQPPIQTPMYVPTQQAYYVVPSLSYYSPTQYGAQLVPQGLTSWVPEQQRTYRI